MNIFATPYEGTNVYKNFQSNIKTAFRKIDSNMQNQTMEDAINSIVDKFPEYYYKSPEVMAIAWYVLHQFHKLDIDGANLLIEKLFEKYDGKKDKNKIIIDVASYYDRLIE